MARIYIETYGCQMNVADTELIFGQLGRHGHSRTTTPDDADVVLLNTCAIREHAEERVIGRLGTLSQHKQERPHVRLGIAGCMAQHVRDGLMDRLPFVDFVVGPDAYRRLPELLEQSSDSPFLDVRLDKDETYADLAPQREAGVRGWVTIMRGCDKFCTFCIVPYVRGRERSLPADALIGQVRELAADGFREVIYLGQTVNAYNDGQTNFAELLRRTNEVEGIERIRFTSPHPSDMTDDVIAAMAECEKVCPQLHLPVQSGSDAVLAKMRRDYTVDEYYALVDRLRTAIPGLAMSTDIIVGFPGETEKDFEATCELLRTVRYDNAFQFQYSSRSHTKAGKWEETVAAEEKSRRLQHVIQMQEEISRDINNARHGDFVEVLVEGTARKREGWVRGKAEDFKTTVFASDVAVPGDTVRVQVEDSTTHTLIGVAVN